VPSSPLFFTIYPSICPSSFSCSYFCDLISTLLQPFSWSFWIPIFIPLWPTNRLCCFCHFSSSFSFTSYFWRPMFHLPYYCVYVSSSFSSKFLPLRLWLSWIKVMPLFQHPQCFWCHQCALICVWVPWFCSKLKHELDSECANSKQGFLPRQFISCPKRVHHLQRDPCQQFRSWSFCVAVLPNSCLAARDRRSSYYEVTL